MKKGKIIIRIVLISIFILSIVSGMQLVFENSELRAEVERLEMDRDDFYGQLDELAFVVENAGQYLDNYVIYDGLIKFKMKRYEELRRDGFEKEEILVTSPERARKLYKLYGLHRELEFDFDENGKLVKLIYEKYKTKYRRH